jgi:preprotein translocase subunit SecY
VLRRITAPGAIFLGIVAILPFLLSLLLSAFNIGLVNQNSVLLVNSAGLLIVVGVVRDTFFTIDAELKLHGYEDTLLVR